MGVLGDGEFTLHVNCYSLRAECGVPFQIPLLFLYSSNSSYQIVEFISPFFEYWLLSFTNSDQSNSHRIVKTSVWGTYKPRF